VASRFVFKAHGLHNIAICLVACSIFNVTQRSGGLSPSRGQATHSFYLRAVCQHSDTASETTCNLIDSIRGLV